jgi:aryl-alcohol dehydrogenase-like predicted oxidoreductase
MLRQPGVTSVIVGPRTLEHLDAALAAASVHVPQDALDAIDAVVPPGRATLPQYGHDGLACTAWGPHRHAWR